MGLDEAGRFRCPLTVDDRFGAGLLGVQGLLITAGTFGRIRPDRPPRPDMLVGVPDRFGSLARVIDFGAGMSRCDGVDDLPVGENITVPMEMRREIDRSLHRP